MPEAPGALGVPCGGIPAPFHLPSSSQVREIMQNEGLPAYVALGGGRGFVPKRLCLDGGGGKLYVLEADSVVPSIFLGIPGFGLGELRRIVTGAAQSPTIKPLLSLEFEEGFLPVRLDDATMLHGFV